MIRQASFRDTGIVSTIACKLWPSHTQEELEAEFASVLRAENSAVFLYAVGSQTVGFAQCQLRSDYVEGTKSSPVAYLEGIYVLEEYRHRGIARALLGYCEQWVHSKGCAEFASDCELINQESQKFHLRAGFQEANRIVCYTKRLSTPSRCKDEDFTCASAGTGFSDPG